MGGQARMSWWSATQGTLQSARVTTSSLSSFFFKGTRSWPPRVIYVCMPSLMLSCRPCTQVVGHAVMRTLFGLVGNLVLIQFAICKETPMDATPNIIKDRHQ